MHGYNLYVLSQNKDSRCYKIYSYIWIFCYLVSGDSTLAEGLKHTDPGARSHNLAVCGEEALRRKEASHAAGKIQDGAFRVQGSIRVL